MELKEELLGQIYAALNRHDIDTLLSVMHPSVAWPNTMDGGVVHGHDGVRAYWSRQWAKVYTHVVPVGFICERDGRIAAYVKQQVRDLAGRIIRDGYVCHIYKFESGLIMAMEIRETSASMTS